MPSIGGCNWQGISGTVYAFDVFPLTEDFTVGVKGNYIFAKLMGNTWIPIYIGEGDLGTRITPQHHQAKCIIEKGATHIHAHLNSNDKARLAEEQDLLGYYTNAYAPAGCNVKEGG